MINICRFKTLKKYKIHLFRNTRINFCGLNNILKNNIFKRSIDEVNILIDGKELNNDALFEK